MSTEPCLVCCKGSSLEVINALDKAPSQKTVFHYPFILSPVHIEKMMHKPEFQCDGQDSYVLNVADVVDSVFLIFG